MMRIFPLLFLFIFGTLSQTLFQLYQLNIPCNDGTPAGYYFRPGYGEGSTKWVIRLQGGGWCWDHDSCLARLQYSPWWTTSKMLPSFLRENETISGVPHEGILSSNPTLNPTHYNANQVYLWYCSSDSHIGNQSKSSEIDWHFRGKDIVTSMINELFHVQKPSLSTAKNILVTGDSAGGVAALNNLNYIYKLITAKRDNNFDYRGYVDAGWFLDFPAYGDTSFSFAKCAELLYKNWNVIYDESCTAHYSTEPWKCFHAQYVVDFLNMPVIFTEFQTDQANLNFNGIQGSNFNSSQLEYIYSFRTEMLRLTDRVRHLFMPNCIKHEIEDTSLFQTVRVDGKSFPDVLTTWFTEPIPKDLVFKDVCNTLNCNPTC